MVKKPTLTSLERTKNVTAKPLDEKIHTIAGKTPAGQPIDLSHALGLEPKSPWRLKDLYQVLRDKSLAVAKAVQRLGAALTEGLPRVLRGPLTHEHFGFKTVEEMADWLLRQVTAMRTRHKSLESFSEGIEGWEANFIGRILHERLVKHHPKLREWFDSMAEDFVDLLNKEIRENGSVTLSRPDKNKVTITTPFTNLRAVEDTAIRGETGPARKAPDFGFLADSEGMTVLIPVEIKLEAALGGAPAQLERLIPRLARKNQTLLATPYGAAEGTQSARASAVTAPEVESIPSERILLSTHDGTRVVVSNAAAELATEANTRTADELANGLSVHPVTIPNPTNNIDMLVYWRVDTGVSRKYLEDIVKLFTGRR